MLGMALYYMNAQYTSYMDGFGTKSCMVTILCSYSICKIMVVVVYKQV